MSDIRKAELTFPADDQIKVVREFDAPADLVYRAATDTELIPKWWGARRGSMTVEENDLRVGGKWKFTMHATDDFPEFSLFGEYLELEPGKRIVQTEAFSGAPEPEANANVDTMTLTESGGVTTMELLIQCVSKESRDAQIESGMEAGMQESYEDLEKVAQSLA